MTTLDLLPKVSDLYSQTNQLLALANNMVPTELERSGGYLTILDGETGKVLLILSCGIIPPEKAEKYLEFSQEKAYRLFAHKEHKTSYESKDETNSMFPGAIRGEEGIYSFSGHQTDVDEAISISAFYLIEPSMKARLHFYGKDLFKHYYHSIPYRNQFAKPFLDSARRCAGNIYMDDFFRLFRD
jgi:hypothetical protein